MAIFVLKFIIVLTRNFIFCNIHLSLNFQRYESTAEDDGGHGPQVEEMERKEGDESVQERLHSGHRPGK